MSTLICGYDELSACPSRSFLTAEIFPTTVSVTLTTCQFTAGIFAGTRPYISLSKSSTISRRLFFHHVSALVTFFPFFNNNGSGKDVYAVAFDSSALAAFGACGLPEGPGLVEVIFN